MSFLPKWIYSFSEIPNQTPAQILVDIDKIVLKFKWKEKRIGITKMFFWKRKMRPRNRYIIFQDFSYSVSGWRRDILKQWGKKKKRVYRYIPHWFLAKMQRQFHAGKTAFSTNVVKKVGIHWLKKSFERSFSCYTKINSKSIMDWRVKLKTL